MILSSSISASKGICRRTLHERFVVFAFALGHGIQRIQNELRETALPQPFHGPSFLVAFHDIVQHGHNPLLLRLNAEHDPERMQDVRMTSPVLLPLMGFDRNRDCFFEE